jgi:sialidase-1
MCDRTPLHTRRPRWPLTLLSFALLLSCGGNGGVETEIGLTQTPLWTAGEDGYHTYRIPALLTTKDGTLLAFCEGRKDNGRDHGNIDLLVKRSTDGGETWSPHQIVYEEGGDSELTIGNPAPVVDQDTGTIWMPFCRNNKEVLLTKSEDDGLTWSEPANITGSVTRGDWVWVATGPGVSIQLQQGPHKGRLVVPTDHGVMVGEQRIMHSHVFYSDDHGETWQLGGLLPEHTDESQVVELTDGRLLLNMRSYWGKVAKQADRLGKRALAWSEDGGTTWSDLAFDETLIEPVCQASFLRYTLADKQGKDRVIYSGPASTTERVNMTVRLSYDEGESWPVAKALHAGPSAYSSLAVLPDGTIACLYERGGDDAYETLTVARFTLDWLTSGEDTLQAAVQ